jgi:hypothetical protein
MARPGNVATGTPVIIVLRARDARTPGSPRKTFPHQAPAHQAAAHEAATSGAAVHGTTLTGVLG